MLVPRNHVTKLYTSKSIELLMTDLLDVTIKIITLTIIESLVYLQEESTVKCNITFQDIMIILWHAYAGQKNSNMHLPRVELRTCCVWDNRDNHYTTDAGVHLIAHRINSFFNTYQIERKIITVERQIVHQWGMIVKKIINYG